LHLVGERGQVTGLAEQADGIVGPGTEGGQIGQHLIPGNNVGRTHIRSISEGYDKMSAGRNEVGVAGVAR
jgi:hypothetical protein